MRTISEITYNETIPGHMMPIELDHLDSLASSIPAGGIIVEIGSLYGRSGYCLATANPEVTVYCTDLWNPNVIAVPPYCNAIELFSRFTATCTNIRPRKVVYGGNMFELDENIDMLFLDAVHENPSDWSHIQYWLPKIKPGGILSGHDYNPLWPDVVTNVQRLENAGYQRMPMVSGSTIWCFRIG